MPAGRPTKFNQELADLICNRVATIPKGLRQLCAMFDDMPSDTTINDWRGTNQQFSLQYARAKLKQADLLAEDCLSIADDDSIDWNRARLRIDTRKWLASKLLPKQYGEHAQLGQEKNEVHEEVMRRKQQLLEENKKEL